MSFREHEIRLLRAGALQEAGNFLQKMRMAASEALQEDIERDDLTASPDEYMLRSNAIAQGMAEAGAFELAETIYRVLDGQVRQFNQQTGKTRHRGALLANRGLLNIRMRRYDEAVSLFRYIAEEIDPKTYNIDPEDSYANVLRSQALDGPALKVLLDILAFTKIPVSPPVSRRELESVFDPLGQGRFALYAAILFLRDNVQVALEVPTLYPHLRILDSLRVFAFQLEEAMARLAVAQAMVRGLPEPSDSTNLLLLDAIKALFCGSIRKAAWWPLFQQELDQNGNVDKVPDKSRSQAESERLAILAERQVSKWDDVVINSLAILHLLRNIAAHQIYPPAYVISAEANLERVIA